MKDILSLSPSKIKNEVEQLQEGAKESLASIVMTEIDELTFADIRKIKSFEEIFETNILSRAMNAV